MNPPHQAKAIFRERKQASEETAQARAEPDFVNHEKCERREWGSESVVGITDNGAGNLAFGFGRRW
jgi:hypothetical protein